MSKLELNNTDSKSFYRSFLVDVLIAVFLAAAVLYFVRPTVVKQSSMEDTFMENDYLLMLRQAYNTKDPERGDIVIFQSGLLNEDTGKSKLLIKRIVGLPGDTIEIKNDQLYLNGKAYREDYLKDGITPAGENPAEGQSVIVPAGKYYVMGDNRLVSVDSRYEAVGFIEREAIKGKIAVRLFPITKFAVF